MSCPWEECGDAFECTHVEPERGAAVKLAVTPGAFIPGLYLGRIATRRGYTLAVVDTRQDKLRAVHPSKVLAEGVALADRKRGPFRPIGHPLPGRVVYCRCASCGYESGNVVTLPPWDAKCPRCEG